MAVELVDRAEGLDPGVILADPRAAEEAGFTGIAGLRVDLHAAASFVARPTALYCARMRKTFNPIFVSRCLVFAACACAGERARRAALSAAWRRAHLCRADPQVTDGLAKAGEGYFAPDAAPHLLPGRARGYPFYQIYVQPFDAAAHRGRRRRADQHGPRPHHLLLVFARRHTAVVRVEPSRSRPRPHRGRRPGPGRGGRPHGPTPALPVGLRSRDGDLFGAALDGGDLVRLTDIAGLRRGVLLFARRLADPVRERPRRRSRHLRDERRRHGRAATDRTRRATTAARSSRPTAAGSPTAPTGSRRTCSRST